ncbi:MAG TPA: lysylphosphatidylglycerol synthase transmembrane domain-containing protein [Blastocatellia bacterium]
MKSESGRMRAQMSRLPTNLNLNKRSSTVDLGAAGEGLNLTASSLSRGGLILGVLLLATVIFVVKNIGEERQFAALLTKAEPGWLLVGLICQAGTYLCAAGVWCLTLNRSGENVSLLSLAPLGVAKLFIDQIIPTAGVGGSLLVVRGLVRRGAPRRLATAALLIDILSFYGAHALAVAIAIVILWLRQELHPIVLVLATVFSVVAVVVPLAILWLTRRAEPHLPGWIERLPGVNRLLANVADAPREVLRDRQLFWQATLLQFAIFTLDAATLDCMLRAIGHPSRPDAVFASFSMAVVAATVSLIPRGLGVFEGSSVMMLRFLNIPIEVALAATLLLRAYSLWLPMIPGLLITKRENLRGHNGSGAGLS